MELDYLGKARWPDVNLWKVCISLEGRGKKSFGGAGEWSCTLMADFEFQVEGK